MLLAAYLLAGCAGSSSRLLAPARPAIDPAAVRIYRTPPQHYQEIAVLDATSGAKFFHGSPQGEAEALQRLKEEAAKVGANGVLLTLVGDRSRGVLGVGVGGGGISSGRTELRRGRGVGKRWRADRAELRARDRDLRFRLALSAQLSG